MNLLKTFCPKNGNINNLHMWNDDDLDPWQAHLEEKGSRIFRIQNQNVHGLHMLYIIR